MHMIHYNLAGCYDNYHHVLADHYYRSCKLVRATEDDLPSKSETVAFITALIL